MIKTRIKKPFFIIFIVVFIIGLFIHNVQAEQNSAMVIELEGTINPGTAQFVIKGLKRAEASKHKLVIIRLDTPGGLDSSMRSIVKAILNSSIPIVVYVAPRGARAASAGVMITIAAHVAAMA
ncbi:MAG: nodulation protein NfeD, partial [Desulfobacteraceae bacterium]